MSLLYWLPFTNGTIENYGLSRAVPTTYGASVVSNDVGKLGKCMQFGTASGRIDIPVDDIASHSGSCSIAFWVNFISLGGNYSTVFSMTNNSPAWNSEIICFQKNGANSTFLFTIANNSNSVQANCQTGTISTGVWYHFVCVYDASDNHIEIYMNGESIKTYSVGFAPAFSTIKQFEIAQSYGGYQGNFKLNDFRVYDEALSPREIKEISKGLVLHYPLNREGFGVDNICKIKDVNLSGSDYGSYSTRSYDLEAHIGKIQVTDTAHKWNSWRFGASDLDTTCQELTTGTNTYTASVDMRVTNYTTGTIGCGLDFRTNNIVSVSGNTALTIEQCDGNWHRISTTLTTNNSQDSQCLWYIGSNNTIHGSQTTIEYKNWKLERGSKATPWIPYKTDSLYHVMGLDDGTVYDTSGYKYNGTVVDGGISYSSDTVRYNVSAEFDGVNSAIAIPWSIFYKQGDVFTLNLWWKKSSLGSKNYETLFGGSGIEMDTRAGGASTLSLYMASTRGGNLYTPFSFNEWYMNTLVNDGTNELYYVNGQLVKTIEKKNMPTGTCYIGAWTSHTSQNYKGLISDFRIYKTALSADDILELYHTPITLSNNGTLMTQGEYVEV